MFKGITGYFFGIFVLQESMNPLSEPKTGGEISLLLCTYQLFLKYMVFLVFLGLYRVFIGF